MQIQTTSMLETARRLAEDFATRADEADREGKLPEEDIQALLQSGYLTLTIPSEYGGLDMGMQDCVAAQITLAKGSASTGLVAAMQLQVLGNARDTRTWDDATYEKLCRAAVEENALFNSIATEPLLGSPSRGHFFKTVARPDGDDYIVNGHKTWTTGGQHLTHMLVRVSLEESSGVVLIQPGMSGIKWHFTWGDGLSLRASDSHDVIFEDVRIPAENVIEAGVKPPFPNGWFPMMLASTYLGAAEAARDKVIQYALERVPTALGKPIATLPAIQRQIGEIDMALQAARCLMLSAAKEWEQADDKESVYYRIATAKHFATETASEVTEKALRIAGGISLTRTLPLERYFRDVRAGLMQPPSGDTAYEIIGKQAIEQIENNQ